MRPKHENIYEGKGSKVLSIFFENWYSIKEASKIYEPNMKTRQNKTVRYYFNQLKKKKWIEERRILKEVKRGNDKKPYTNICLRYRLNLNFLYKHAREKRIIFTENEKYCLEEIFEWPGIRYQINRDKDFRQNFQLLIQKLIGFTATGGEEEALDWETTNNEKIKAKKKYYLHKKLETSTYSTKQIAAMINKLEKINGKLAINEIINCIPYTLLIKLMSLYLPFDIGRELIKNDITDIMASQEKELTPDKEFYSAKEMKKPKTKLQLTRIEILNKYNIYRRSAFNPKFDQSSLLSALKYLDS